MDGSTLINAIMLIDLFLEWPSYLWAKSKTVIEQYFSFILRSI